MFGFDVFGMGNMMSINVCPGCGRMLLTGEFSAGGLCQECCESEGDEADDDGQPRLQRHQHTG